MILTVIALAISLPISIWGDINYDKFGLGFLAAIHLAIFASVLCCGGQYHLYLERFER